MDIEEICKKINHFEYWVSNKGRVKSKWKILKYSWSFSRKEYYKVILSNKDKPKSFRVHRLVAEYFIPNPQNKREVNHIDGNKLNNNLNNL